MTRVYNTENNILKSKSKPKGPLRIWRIARDPDTGYWVSIARINGDNVIRDERARQVSAELGRAIAERFLKDKDSRCFVSSAARIFNPKSIRETEKTYK